MATHRNILVALAVMAPSIRGNYPCYEPDMVLLNAQNSLVIAGSLDTAAGTDGTFITALSGSFDEGSSGPCLGDVSDAFYEDQIAKCGDVCGGNDVSIECSVCYIFLSLQSTLGNSLELTGSCGSLGNTVAIAAVDPANFGTCVQTQAYLPNFDPNISPYIACIDQALTGLTSDCDASLTNAFSTIGTTLCNANCRNSLLSCTYCNIFAGMLIASGTTDSSITTTTTSTATTTSSPACSSADMTALKAVDASEVADCVFAGAEYANADVVISGCVGSSVSSSCILAVTNQWNSQLMNNCAQACLMQDVKGCSACSVMYGFEITVGHLPQESGLEGSCSNPTDIASIQGINPAPFGVCVNADAGTQGDGVYASCIADITGSLSGYCATVVNEEMALIAAITCAPHCGRSSNGCVSCTLFAGMFAAANIMETVASSTTTTTTSTTVGPTCSPDDMTALTLLDPSTTMDCLTIQVGTESFESALVSCIGQSVQSACIASVVTDWLGDLSFACSVSCAGPEILGCLSCSTLFTLDMTLSHLPSGGLPGSCSNPDDTAAIQAIPADEVGMCIAVGDAEGCTVQYTSSLSDDCKMVVNTALPNTIVSTCFDHCSNDTNECTVCSIFAGLLLAGGVTETLVTTTTTTTAVPAPVVAPAPPAAPAPTAAPTPEVMEPQTTTTISGTAITSTSTPPTTAPTVNDTTTTTLSTSTRYGLNSISALFTIILVCGSVAIA